jgi:hypothetical protein
MLPISAARPWSQLTPVQALVGQSSHNLVGNWELGLMDRTSM